MKDSGRPVRITRTISIRPDQDLWISEVTEGRTVSRFIQALLDAAIAGAFDLEKLKNAEGSGIDRALTYLKAKEAGIMFEEDVAQVLKEWSKGQAGRHDHSQQSPPGGSPVRFRFLDRGRREGSLLSRLQVLFA